MRLRQILLNLLANARTWTTEGSVTLSAEVDPPYLHVRVTDTGPGIRRSFSSGSSSRSPPRKRLGHGAGGIGLGLPISRHLAALHGGSLTIEQAPGRGAVFHLRLPLPDLAGDAVPAHRDSSPCLLLVTRAAEPPHEIAELARRRGFEILRLDPEADWTAALAAEVPAALAWDLATAASGDRPLVLRSPGTHGSRRCRSSSTADRRSPHPMRLHPTRLSHPIRRASSLTGFVAKTAPPAPSGSWWRRSGRPRTVLVVDDDPEARNDHAALAAEGLPGVTVRTAADGEEALAAMAGEIPGLVLLDLVMPRMDGFALLERMRADPRLRRVPVVVLTNKLLDADDVTPH